MASVTKPILLDETGKRIAHGFEALTSQQSLIYLLYKSGLNNGALKFDPTYAAYRFTAPSASNTATIPTPDISEIPVAAMYYCFELEVAVPLGTTTLVGPYSGVPFDATANYSDGDCVIYSGKLYKFDSAHSAGAWTGEDATEIPNAALSWTFLEGGDLPDATDAASKTLYISCRLDCTARTVVANVWRIA